MPRKKLKGSLESNTDGANNFSSAGVTNESLCAGDAIDSESNADGTIE